jgi:hypothetical protein
VDDDAAIDASEEQTISAEGEALAAAEEAQAKAEAERAQAEQQRLAAIQLAEDAANKHKDEERRRLASAPDHVVFVLAGVRINQIVFDIAEAEDLELFPEVVETLVEAELGYPEADMEAEALTAAVAVPVAHATSAASEY